MTTTNQLRTKYQSLIDDLLHDEKAGGQGKGKQNGRKLAELAVPTAWIKLGFCLSGSIWTRTIANTAYQVKKRPK